MLTARFELRALCGHLFYLCLGLLLLLHPGEAYQKISDEKLKSLPRPGEDFDIHTGSLLSPILRTRVPGTPGHTAVLEHLTNFFRTSLPKWEIEFQNSTSKTPISHGKEVPFVNFIAYRDPPGVPKGDVGRLTLVAHYDSKIDPKGFIGAIDSAAPCAMIMHAVRSIDSALERKWAAMQEQGMDLSDEHQGVQVLFLDGEEAFLEWSATDSLYGARSLAEHWDKQVNPAMSAFKSPLSAISLFVLLDLLGAKKPTIQSYYPTTHWAYQNLGTLEKRLRSLDLMKSNKTPWFVDADKNAHQVVALGGIQDDHLPFLARGVEILHLIDYAHFRGFPEVWHTALDDAEHLDMDTVEDWSVLMTAFAAEWMDLENFLEHSEAPRQMEEIERGEDTQTVDDERKTEL
ncbi:Peptide hydrolase [Penicillium ucsense]|uniref:Peptide hydrolase n=1 Tax=Penicillium ucsense TaxID=2839758 RepID=A0A8J8WJ74_9EURO|nr:Peptide hydrolase [Penicillium ucsense]KAF7735729.1 Peptide hydrolase [Penicillium ucsense]